MAKESLKAMDNLANVFFGRLLKGAHPTVFHSPHVSMELYRQQAGDPMPPDMEVRGGSFLLPPDLAFENVSGYLDRNVSYSKIPVTTSVLASTYSKLACVGSGFVGATARLRRLFARVSPQ